MLNNGTIISPKNMGFRLKNNQTFTYSQEKIGFNYFYCKRKVLGDGLSTVPLDIDLCSWQNNVKIIEKVQDPLSNLYPCNLLYNNIIFPSSEHLFIYLLCVHFNYYNIAAEILRILDPIDLHKFISDKGVNLNKDYGIIERTVRFSILIKLKQCPLFYDKLSKMATSLIYYKQVNLKRDLAGYLGVTTKSSLLKVLSSDNVSGENIVGKILMDILGYKKIKSKYCYNLVYCLCFLFFIHEIGKYKVFNCFFILFKIMG